MNLFEKNSDVHGNKLPYLVIPVNCRGIMGAGMAKQAQEYFENASKVYKQNARNLVGGDILIVPEITSLYEGAVLFATKEHWKQNSKLEWIDKGSQALAKTLKANSELFFYIPALGTGLGKLPIEHVHYVITSNLRHVTDQYCLYIPERKYKGEN
jgi:hypothetical protein